MNLTTFADDVTFSLHLRPLLRTCSAVTAVLSAVDDATFSTPSARRFLMGNNLFGHPARNGGCKTMMVTAELIKHHRAIKTVKYECSICGTIKRGWLRANVCSRWLGLDLFVRIRMDLEWGAVKNVAVALWQKPVRHKNSLYWSRSRRSSTFIRSVVGETLKKKRDVLY